MKKDLADRREARFVLFAFFLCIFTILGEPDANATDDASLEYRTITTPHFFVHYYKGVEELAFKVAVVAEEAHTILSPLLDWEPVSRTHIVIDDKGDSANGSATVFGRSHINIFGMAPESESVLGFYDDWLRILVFHEYVHILHLDTIVGLPAQFNKVIGKQWSPNQFLPRWYTEGLATYYESRRTKGGRLDSSLFQMFLRTSALDGSLFDLGATSNAPVAWPSGSVAYLYGSSFLAFVFEKHGEDFAAQFHRAFGYRIIPWSMNSVSKELVDDTFTQMWEEWNASLLGDAMAKRMRVIASGRTKYSKLTNEGGNSRSLKRRGDKLTFQKYDFESSAEIVEIQDDGSLKHLFTLRQPSPGYDWDPSGRNLYYTQTMTYNSIYRYRDIFRWDSKTGRVHRLTEGERAREPSISPDGSKIAYVRNRKGTMELVVKQVKHMSGEAKVLISGLRKAATNTKHPPKGEHHWMQIATPVFSPDGKKIAFSWWRLDKRQRDIWTIDIESGKREQMTDDFALDIDPYWHSDNRIYFSTDRTKIFNIHSVDPATKKVFQESNVLSGMFTPIVTNDSKHIYGSIYQSKGYDAASIAKSDNPSLALVSEKEDLKVNYPKVDTSTFYDDPYSPTDYLLPLLFNPQIGVLSGGTGFGGTLSGYDPVRKHVYEIAGGFTLGQTPEDKSSSLSVFYSYGALPVSLTLSGSFRERLSSRSLFAESRFIPFTLREYAATAKVSYPFSALSDRFSLSFDFRFEYSDFADEVAIEHDPADLEPRAPKLGFFNSAILSLSYSNTEFHPLSVTGHKGISASISINMMDPIIGADYQSSSFFFGLDGFVPNPWWKRHSLNLHLDGAISLATDLAPRGFSLGGYAPQDVLTSLVFQEQRRQFVIRGYKPAATSGTQYLLAGAEYRFPIYDFDRGFELTPIYFRQLKGSIFYEGGAAYRGFLADADILTGLGAEVSMNVEFAYYLFGNLRLGYARGLAEQGINEVYFIFGGGF